MVEQRDGGDRVRETDTLVIGASAAGLAAAACLKDAGVAFEVLEATDHVGDAWRHHYDRLHLHTPKSASGLPGLPMPRSWPRYPSRDQVVQYLEHYAGHHGITPHFGTDALRTAILLTQIGSLLGVACLLYASWRLPRELGQANSTYRTLEYA